jgi:hypothetical protein
MEDIFQHKFSLKQLDRKKFCRKVISEDLTLFEKHKKVMTLTCETCLEDPAFSTRGGPIFKYKYHYIGLT